MADGSLNDRIADRFTAHGIDLLRVERRTARKITSLLYELEDELAATLNKIDPMGVSERYRPKRLQSLIEQGRETVKTRFRDAEQTLRGDLRTLVSIEADFVARVVNNEAGVILIDGVIAPERLRAIVGELTVQGAPVSDWWSRQAGDTLNRFTDQMRLGMAAGETNAQLIQRVRGGTRDGVNITGVMPTTRQHADSLVRSATQAVSEAAKGEVYAANADIIGAVVWTATLDSRTTLECAARDGLRYHPVTKEPIGHNLPWGKGPGQFHWGCRSASRPETKSWRELGLDVDDLPPATRASMDGQVAADQKFEDWLKKQSVERQNAVLGKGRADLWRDGRITMRDMLNQEGRPLSLDQLKKKIEEELTQPKAKPRKARAKAAPKPIDLTAPPVFKTTSAAAKWVEEAGFARSSGFGRGYDLEGVQIAVEGTAEVFDAFDIPPLEHFGDLTKDPRKIKYRGWKGANGVIYPGVKALGVLKDGTSLQNRERQVSVSQSAQSRAHYARERQRLLENVFTSPEVVKLAARVPEYGHSASLGLSAKETVRHTAYHEMGHALHFLSDAKEEIDAALKRHNIMAERWHLLIGDYAGSAEWEYIAEAFALYMRGEQHHFRIHPEILKIFKRRDKRQNAS